MSYHIACTKCKAQAPISLNAISGHPIPKGWGRIFGQDSYASERGDRNDLVELAVLCPTCLRAHGEALGFVVKEDAR